MELFLLIIFILLFGTMIWAGFSGAPWVPAFKKDLKFVLVQPELKNKSVICDLGCGDGRFLFLAGNKLSAEKLIGYEISLGFYLLAMVKKIISPNRKRIQIKYQNFYLADLSQVDLAYGFLIPRIMPKVEKLLASGLKPGTLFVSYAFKLPVKKPVKVIRRNEKSLPFYFYDF